MAHAPDLVVLAVAFYQARSKAAKTRTLRALKEGLAWWAEHAVQPGRCPTCGYKRRTKRDLLDITSAEDAARNLKRLGKALG